MQISSRAGCPSCRCISTWRKKRERRPRKVGHSFLDSLLLFYARCLRGLSNRVYVSVCLVTEKVDTEELFGLPWHKSRLLSIDLKLTKDPSSLICLKQFSYVDFRDCQCSNVVANLFSRLYEHVTKTGISIRGVSVAIADRQISPFSPSVRQR